MRSRATDGCASAVSAFTLVLDRLWLAAVVRRRSGARDGEAVGPGSAEQHKCCAASGTRCSCLPRGTVQAVMQMLGIGESERRALLARHGERGRRRTRQDQISLKAWRPGWAWKPVKLRTARIRTERRKLVSSAGPIFDQSELFSKMRSSRLT